MKTFRVFLIPTGRVKEDGEHFANGYYYSYICKRRFRESIFAVYPFSSYARVKNRNLVCISSKHRIPWHYRADDTHLKMGEGGWGTQRVLKKCHPPWLGDEENFEIYKL